MKKTLSKLFSFESCLRNIFKNCLRATASRDNDENTQKIRIKHGGTKHFQNF